MDGVVDASHDSAQHSAASALATMGGPSALGPSPDLTGLSPDEVQMPLCFCNHSNMAVFMTVKNKLHEPESSLGMSFEMAFHLHIFESCLQHIHNKRTQLYCVRSFIIMGIFIFCIQQALLLMVVFCIVLHCTTV